MPPRSRQKPASSFSIKDAFLALYSHKWKIIILTLMGLGAASYLYVNRKPVYQSDAELLVRYVVDRSTVDPYDSQSGVGGRSGEYVINSEIKILKSQDLAFKVAEKVGADQVLTHVTGSRNLDKAASLVRTGMEVIPGKRNHVLGITYQHPDREMAKTVLESLVQSYFERHLEIRRSTDSYSFFSGQVSAAAERLKETEAQLNKLKTDLGILDLPTTLTLLETQRSSTKQDLFAAEADLAEQQARVGAYEKLLAENGELNAIKPSPEISVAESNSKTKVTREVMLDFHELSLQLQTLRKQKQGLLMKFTESTSIVELTQRQIDTVERRRAAYIKKYPELVAAKEAVSLEKAVAEIPMGPNLDYEQAKLAANTARLKMLREQKIEIDTQIKSLASQRSLIEELERRQKAESEKYQLLQSSLERARLDETLDPSKIPNISIVQHPTAAFPVFDAKMKQITMGVAVSGLILGVGIAFLIEFILDQRVKRAGELEGRLQIPLMLKVPLIKNRDQKRLSGPEGGEEVHEHFINPYATAIRDRLFYNFELENVTHRPKLIAVTGLSKGAGASTIAGGLAASLQGAGEARVLLVDMARNKMHDLNLSADARNHKKLDAPVVDLVKTQRISLKAALDEKVAPKGEDTLYLSSGSLGENDAIERDLAPRKLFEMLPTFRRSEFDYIVFDMPPLGPISPTVAMAGIMDQVILVLDAQKTDRAELKESFRELSKGKAKVSSVFNKTRETSPRWLEG